MRDGLVQTAHKPADTDEPGSPDIDHIGHRRPLERLERFTVSVALDQERASEERVSAVHDFIIGKVIQLSGQTLNTRW